MDVKQPGIPYTAPGAEAGTTTLENRLASHTKAEATQTVITNSPLTISRQNFMHTLPRGVCKSAPSSIIHRNQRMDSSGVPTISGEAYS